MGCSIRPTRAGMSIARFNFSHGSHAYHAETLRNLRTACEEGGHTCGVLLDTKGPEVRTGTLRGGGTVTYTEGSQVQPPTRHPLLHFLPQLSSHLHSRLELARP